ncbi:DUF6573 family protein [Nocardia jejuensis]|uniref:DUF6573 family protein n=1 Tax=Nocardia jejuensis TaxID=328049 RepID=UPI00082C5697|nr:DUF6573 family protein [Nocardia jejuensis]
MSENAEIIDAYTRAQAIADGVLHDVTATASEYGFRYPVAVAEHAWHEAIAWPADGGHCQDETGRLWDVLTMAHFAIASAIRTNTATHSVEFTVARIIADDPDPEPTPKPITLTIHIGPGDDANPVFTIMARHDH